MGVGKYYCDYCDKQFQDTAVARRRHLQGIAHQKAKAQWYDAVWFSSQPSFVDQVHHHHSFGKGVCNRFVRTGSCQYGDSCKYYHPKKNMPNMNTQGTEAALFGNQMGTSLGNLPPSLWPPPEGGYPSLPCVDWG